MHNHMCVNDMTSIATRVDNCFPGLSLILLFLYFSWDIFSVYDCGSDWMTIIFRHLSCPWTRLASQVKSSSSSGPWKWSFSEIECLLLLNTEGLPGWLTQGSPLIDYLLQISNCWRLPRRCWRRPIAYKYIKIAVHPRTLNSAKRQLKLSISDFRDIAGVVWRLRLATA